MKLQSVACLAVAAAAPAGSQAFRFDVVGTQLDQTAAVRRAAISRCAESVAQPIGQAFGTAVSAATQFDIIGLQYRNNGNYRIFGRAVPTEAQRLAAFEFTCDVDSRGNLRKLDLGSAKWMASPPPSGPARRA